jgi:hypothetical protein
MCFKRKIQESKNGTFVPFSLITDDLKFKDIKDQKATIDEWMYCIVLSLQTFHEKAPLRIEDKEMPEYVIFLRFWDHEGEEMIFPDAFMVTEQESKILYKVILCGNPSTGGRTRIKDCSNYETLKQQIRTVFSTNEAQMVAIELSIQKIPKEYDFWKDPFSCPSPSQSIYIWFTQITDHSYYNFYKQVCLPVEQESPQKKPKKEDLKDEENTSGTGATCLTIYGKISQMMNNPSLQDNIFKLKYFRFWIVDNFIERIVNPTPWQIRDKERILSFAVIPKSIYQPIPNSFFAKHCSHLAYYPQWNAKRLLWIAFKHKADDCPASTLSKDIIREISAYLTGPSKVEFQRPKRKDDLRKDFTTIIHMQDIDNIHINESDEEYVSEPF